jgi:hypothetical protein
MKVVNVRKCRNLDVKVLCNLHVMENNIAGTSSKTRSSEHGSIGSRFEGSNVVV